MHDQMRAWGRLPDSKLLDADLKLSESDNLLRDRA